MEQPHQTAYGHIADRLREEIFAGLYEPSPDDPQRNELPGAADLGARFGVSGKTAARATQQLVAEGLVIARSGMRPVVVPLDQRPNRWPMDRRYARARHAGSMVFGDDLKGHKVEKRHTAAGGPITAPDAVAAALGLSDDPRVIFRSRQTLVDGRVAETSTSFFPCALAGETILAEDRPLPPGGMTHALESLGYRISHTTNEVRARLANAAEIELFGADATLQPLTGRIVLEVSHVVHGPDGDALEAVISVRPSSGNVLVFETDERVRDEE